MPKYNNLYNVEFTDSERSELFALQRTIKQLSSTLAHKYNLKEDFVAFVAHAFDYEGRQRLAELNRKLKAAGIEV